MGAYSKVIDIERIRSIYELRGAPLKSKTIDDARIEVERLRRFVTIPSVDDVIDQLVEEAQAGEKAAAAARAAAAAIAAAEEEHHSAQALNHIELGGVKDRPKISPRGEIRFTIRRPEWIKEQGATAIPNGKEFVVNGYGHAMIGPSYDRINLVNIMPGDVVATLAAPGTNIGAVMRLPSVNDGTLKAYNLFTKVFGSRDTQTFESADKKLLTNIMGQQCPHTLEAYYLIDSFAHLGIDSSLLHGSLVLTSPELPFDSREARPAIAQQLISALHAFNAPLHDIRMIVIETNGADAVFEPSTETVKVAGKEMMTASAEPIALGPIVDAALSIQHAVGYPEHIPLDALLVRQQLLPTAIGLWAADSSAFQAGIAGIHHAMGLVDQTARIDALTMLYQTWHKQLLHRM